MRWRIKIRQVSSPKASFKSKRDKKTAQNGDREIPWGNSSIILLSTMSATHGLCLVSSHLIPILNTQFYIIARLIINFGNFVFGFFVILVTWFSLL